MSAIKAVAAILKTRFNSLTTEETIDLAEKLVEAVGAVPVTAAQTAFILGLDASKCGHGRLHIFCGICNNISGVMGR